MKKFSELIPSVVCLAVGLMLGYATGIMTPRVEAPVADPYEGWGTILPGGVVSMRIPPGCTGDPGAGSIYVVCGDSELPEFVVSSDGIQVNVRRWENLEVAEWDRIVGSIKVIVPITRDIQINIQE